MNSKYSKLLTVILIVAIIIVVILFAFFGYEIYNKYYVEKQTSDMLDVFDNTISNTVTNVVSTPENTTGGSNEVVAPVLSGDENTTTTGQTGGSSSSSTGVTYKGFTMVGKIEIPKINISYPILGKTSKTSIEVAVSVLYGPGPNKVGNTVIMTELREDVNIGNAANHAIELLEEYRERFATEVIFYREVDMMQVGCRYVLSK